MKMIMHEEIPEAQPSGFARQPLCLWHHLMLTVLDESV